MIIKLTKADLLKGQPITPKWYAAEIKKIEHKASRDATSLNYVYTFSIPDANDAEVDHYFNSKAPGMMAPFIAAILKKSLAEIIEGMESGTLDFDTDMPVGKRVMIEVKNEPYEGRLTNKIVGFLPEGAQTPF